MESVRITGFIVLNEWKAQENLICNSCIKKQCNFITTSHYKTP